MFYREYAERLDREDQLKNLRSEFIIPTKGDLKAKSLAENSTDDTSREPCIYLCGNSLGLQPKRTSERVAAHLTAWAKKGVLGHFTEHEDSELAGFINADDQAAGLIAPLVGALREEVAVMETLTANLHFLMASFYRPTKEKYKIILEEKAFPSDHYAIESQIIHHAFDPAEAMVCVEPKDPSTSTLTTAHILSHIDRHASSTALILLPGIQYYSGQLLDIKAITAHARLQNIIIGWDLAHAVGNVELFLHDWNVDFAAWCNYKYINSGPGSIAGLFVHERHGVVDRGALADGKEAYRPRLSGWWGGDKAIRFEMGRRFIPIPGAQGFQVGNPSTLAVTALVASLEVFQMTSMSALREKSMALTWYLEQLLLESPISRPRSGHAQSYRIITPLDPAQRGAQLSILLNPGLQDNVLTYLEHAGVVVDERKPNIVRVAPAPLYNTFEDVWDFVNIFCAACEKVREGQANTGQDAVGWKEGDDKSSTNIE